VAGCVPASTATPSAVAPTVAASAPAAVAAAPLPDTISVAEAAAKRDAGAFILDVRTQDEWNEYHIPGSTLIPLDQIETRLDEVPNDKDVVVVCRSGNRSQPGRDVLKNAGFTQVTSMSGGLKEWKAAGLPTVAGP
jgi:rhodanese-related sulfurtransferase